MSLPYANLQGRCGVCFFFFVCVFCDFFVLFCFFFSLPAAVLPLCEVGTTFFQVKQPCATKHNTTHMDGRNWKFFSRSTRLEANVFQTILGKGAIALLQVSFVFKGCF